MTQIDRVSWRSPNHSSRNGAAISSIVIHSCEGRRPEPRKTSLPWLCNPASEVSSHYYVCRDGTIYQLVDDSDAAWHAGVAVREYQNEHSIGVECEHAKGQDWPVAQKSALAGLLRSLTAAHTIPLGMVDTHGQIAIAGPYERKHDPTDWPRADFLLWRSKLLTVSPPPTPAKKAYTVRGLPIYQRSDLSGPVVDVLPTGAPIEIDVTYPNGAGHDARGRGFVDLEGLTQE